MLKILDKSRIWSWIVKIICEILKMSYLHCKMRNVIGCPWVHRLKILMTLNKLFIQCGHEPYWMPHYPINDKRQIDFLIHCPSIKVGKVIVVGQIKTENIRFILWFTKRLCVILVCFFLPFYITLKLHIEKKSEIKINVENISVCEFPWFFFLILFGRTPNKINTRNFSQSFISSVNKLLS